MVNYKENIIMAQITDRALCVEINGPILKGNYTDIFLPHVEIMLKSYGEVRILMNYKNYEGWTLEAALMDFERLDETKAIIKRAALVNPPEEVLERKVLREKMMDGEIRVFDKLDEAVIWVNGD